MAPWSEGWEQTVAVLRWPALAPWLRSGYVRGGLSGLGVIHVAWGFLEAVGAARAARAARGAAGGG